MDPKRHPQAIQLDQKLDPGIGRALLGATTHIRSMLIPQGQAPQPQETAPEPPQNQETGTDVKAEMQGLESRIFDELSTLKQEIQKVGTPKDQNQEIKDLKDQLQSIIDSND